MFQLKGLQLHLHCSLLRLRHNSRHPQFYNKRVRTGEKDDSCSVEDDEDKEEEERDDSEDRDYSDNKERVISKKLSGGLGPLSLYQI